MLRKPSRSTGIKALGVCALLLATFALLSGFSQPPLDASTKTAAADPKPVNTIVKLVKAVSPAVVNITTKGETRSATWSQRFGHPLPDAWRKFFETPPFSMPGPFGSPGTPRQPRRTQSYGSGVIIDSKGLILTNHHVVAGRKNATIAVTLSDENEFEGTIIGTDEKTDIALIQINAGYTLPTVPLGDSDALEIGEGVLAIGNPFGLDRTVTSGIVSAKGRRIGAGPYDNFIQTDASINPGNSGGPLINHRGEVVGVNTAIYSRGGGNVGIGFAIPINLVKELVPQLRNDGRVTRGWLGVAFQKMTPLLAESLGVGEPRGALVAEVLPDTPAREGGIQAGDVIVEFDENPVKDSGDLPIIVARTPIGKEVGVKVLRGGSERTLKVRIGKLEEKSVATPEEQGSDLGLTVRELTPDTAKKLSVKRTEGILVTAVKPGSPAEEAGLRRGDVILEVNRTPVATLAAYNQALEKVEKGQNALLLVQRGDNTRFFVAKS
ncbi:MAG: DegQ family serine endoprotease [Deltaproteobacteria bacterium]|nr:DegQ family serine endoprotease [Deltaproteobacteria bacterium]